MYASESTDTITIAAAAGPVVVTIQKLNWKLLKKAARLKYDEMVANAARLTAGHSSGALAAALAARAAQAAAEQNQPAQAIGDDAPVAPEARRPSALELERAREARYGQYDQETVLLGGVRSSSDKKAPADLVSDLEEGAADKLHRAILDLTLPAIDAETRETERKNG